jgi:competence ComEA-like helix-hairpin-helix protein
VCLAWAGREENAMDEVPAVIDINQADADALTGLPGIGPVLAKRIIERREEQGPFETITELATISGLSGRTVAAVADRVRVGTPAAPATNETPSPQLEAPDTAQIPDEPGPAETGGDRDGKAEPGLGLAEALANSVPAVDQPETIEPAMEPVSDEAMVADIVLIAPETAEEEDTVGETEAESSGVMDERAAVPVVVASPRPSTSAGAGRGCFLALLAAFLGAGLGILATLLILYTFNGGNLRFASAASTGDLQRNLSREAAEADQAREALAGQLATAQAEAETLAGTVSTLEARQHDLLAEVEQAQADAAALEQTVQELNERFDEMAAAAENFVLFMNGLRDLLVDLQGLPPTPTATPSLTGTPAAGDQTPEPTVTVWPTRTPRPTATPLVPVGPE